MKTKQSPVRKSPAKKGRAKQDAVAKSPVRKDPASKSPKSPVRKGQARKSLVRKVSTSKSPVSKSPARKDLREKDRAESQYVSDAKRSPEKIVASGFPAMVHRVTGLSCGASPTPGGKDNKDFNCPKNHVHISSSKNEPGCCVPLFGGRDPRIMSYGQKVEWIKETMDYIYNNSNYDNENDAEKKMAGLVGEYFLATMEQYQAKMLLEAENMCAAARARGDCDAIGVCEWSPGYLSGGKCVGKMRKQLGKYLGSIKQHELRLARLHSLNYEKGLTAEEKKELTYLESQHGRIEYANEKFAEKINEFTAKHNERVNALEKRIEDCQKDRPRCPKSEQTFLENELDKERKKYQDDVKPLLMKLKGYLPYIMAMIAMVVFLGQVTSLTTEITKLFKELPAVGDSLKNIVTAVSDFTKVAVEGGTTAGRFMLVSSGITAGTAAGAVAGSFVPIIGNVIGGFLGGLAGGVSGLGLGAMASDKRLKMRITPVTDTTPRFYRFYWNASARKKLGLPSTVQYGVIAQEVQQIHPDVVHCRKDGFLVVDYALLAQKMRMGNKTGLKKASPHRRGISVKTRK